jgi:predicted O-linked N-acetylglucosamine transferase (SPINDLY family)
VNSLQVLTPKDVLYAGTPVISGSSAKPAGRMFASMAIAAGLSVMWTRTLEDYATLFSKVCRNPNVREALRSKVAAAVRKSRLFDVSRCSLTFCCLDRSGVKEFETLIELMWDKHVHYGAEHRFHVFVEKK